MADAAIRPKAVFRRQSFTARSLLSWINSASLFKQRRSNTPPIGMRDDVADFGRRDTRAGPTTFEEAHAVCPFPLLNAYAVSALDIARQAAVVDPGPAALNLGPVAIQALVAEVVRNLEPRARKAGLALLRDASSGRDGVCCADPGQLRRVLSHLLLRALSMEKAPGHVRIMVTLTSREARILILSHSPAAILARHADAAREDLVAPQRLLQAMGGSLVLEPRRAGYLPLCIALPALSAAYVSHAA